MGSTRFEPKLQTSTFHDCRRFACSSQGYSCPQAKISLPHRYRRRKMVCLRQHDAAKRMAQSQKTSNTASKTRTSSSEDKFVVLAQSVWNPCAEFLDFPHRMKVVHYSLLITRQLFSQFSGRLTRIFMEKMVQPIFIKPNGATGTCRVLKVEFFVFEA